MIWSLESKVMSKDMIETLMDEKADAVRLVSEKGKVEETLSFIDSLRSSQHEWARQLPVLADMCSYPRGVIVNLEEACELKFGDKVVFTPEGGNGDFQVNSDEWPDLFALDHSVYCGFGMVVLKPIDIKKDKVTLEVVQGGRLLPNADIQVPFTQKTPTMESIPDEAWRISKNPGVDYLILPSVSSAVELEKIRDRILTESHQPWLLLKIGSRQTYENLDQLLPLVRGVIVSRIELAMSMDPAQIPIVTKEIIQKCNQHACMVLIASEMLGSMRYNATPTRAEVSDIANAVFDGADGVLLSEALADGRYLSRGFMLAKRTVEDVESSAEDYPLNWVKLHPTVDNEIEAVTYAAYRAAHRNGARALVCMTKAGNTAFHLRSYGVNIPIVALSTSADVVRRLKIVKGVQGVKLDELPSIDEILPLINNLLANQEGIRDDDKYVFVSITLSSIGVEGSNLFTVQSLSS
ncbi:MAG: pyruvate kinase [Oligoflexus sp.]